MLLGRRSIFNRLVLAFFVVGLITGVPLVLLSIEFNKRSNEVRLRQSVSQQIAIIEDNFRQEFSVGLLRSLRQVTESDSLVGYLLASRDERIIKAKALEKHLLGLQGAYQSYTGIYYVDGEGEFVVDVVNGQRSVETGNVMEKGIAPPDSAAQSTRRALLRLFERIRTAPLLLSSGNMEWFMPPREVSIEGPFRDEQGRMSFLAGLPLVDFDSGGFGGVVFIRLRLDEFAKRLQSVKFLDQNPVWLFGADGSALLEPPAGQDRFDPRPYLAQVVAPSVQILRVDNGLIALRDMTIVKDKPFIRLAYSVPVSAISRDYEPAVYFFVLVLALAMVAVFVLAYFVSRNFSTPIVKLAAAASSLAAGHLSTRVSVPATGEIKVLVESFNQMTEKLQTANKNRSSAFAVLRDTITQMQHDPVGANSQPAELQAAPLLDESEDLTTIRQMIDKLIQERETNLLKVRAAKDSADEANRAKGDFLATMSHEIRTPLNAIIGLSDILAGTPLTAEQMHLVKTMESASGQLLQIINDILDFSRLQSGRVELTETAVDLQPFMNRLMLMIGGLPDAARLEVACSIDPAVPARIITDEGRLMQILTNLLGNAVKFTPQGRVSVRVDTGVSTAGQPVIRFAVSDSGPGIARDMRERIFEPFMQGAAERLRPHAGSGLGLAICRRLSQAMGGNVELRDDPTPGACFVLTLPLRAVSASTWVATAEHTGVGQGQGVRVLVAEDTPANQLVIRMILETAGYSVTLAANGLEAVEAFAAGIFDIVILDIQMPVMDGFEAVRRIRSSGPAGATVPVVALTAFTQDSDREKALASGFTEFTSKPIRPKDIKALLARLGPAR